MIGTVLSLVVGWQALAFANLAGSPFQGGDGDLDPATPTGATGIDWNSFSPIMWSNSGSNAAPYRLSDQTTGGTGDAAGWRVVAKEDAQKTSTDTGFAGGTKQDDNCASVIGGSAPNKDDLRRAYLSTKVINGNTYLNLAWIRIPQNTTSPSAHVGFEFNQAKTACTGPNNGGLYNREKGDLLIVYDFEGSATDNPTLSVRKWVTTGTCEVGSDSPPCWGPSTTLSANSSEAKVNTFGGVTDKLAPPAGTGGGSSTTQSLGTNEFGEASINLTTALPDVFGSSVCSSFGKAEVVSRSSGNSAKASMEDLVGPVDFNLQNCGEIKIIKHTAPRGLNQNFSYTSNIAGTQLSCAADTTPASFTLNDNGNSSSDSTANTEDCTNVPAGSYTVTEGANPAGFAFDSLSCTATGTGSSGSQDATNPKQANITVAGGGMVTCTYVNKQQLGAIKISKVGKNKSLGSGDQPLAGAKFSIKDSNGNPIAGSPFTTGSGGTVCVDNLAFGNYSVQETQAPSGYSIDDTAARTVTVDNNAKCSDSTYVGESSQFTDTPLTDVSVTATSQAPGATESSIVCKDSNGGDVGNSGPNYTDPAQANANNLPPGTYTCTVVIDP